MKIFFLLATSAAAIALGGCASPYASDEPVATASATATATAATEAPAAQSQDINAFFDAYDAAQLELSPLGKAYRGIRDEDYGEWGDYSDAGEKEQYDLLQESAARMRAAYDVTELSEQDALSYRLFDAMAKRSASLWPYRDNDYIFDQMNGAQSRLPAFLINIHRVADESHAADYVSRIEGMAEVLDTLTAEARERADMGVMPPDWVYPYVISDIENLTAEGSSNAILDDFAAKVAALEIADEAKADLVDAAAVAWNDEARPAYLRLLAEMKRQQATAPDADGIWRLPNGAAYYEALLANYTTTDLTADEIHNIGLREVERIHGEMRAIMDKVGFEGSLQDFFRYTRTDDRFFYTSREDYLADANAVLDRMEAKLPKYFGVLPKAPMVIKPVEAFREKSAGKAFYQSPAPDGSRPGTYYVNLYNLRDMSKNELEALAYHEGSPGHHLQRALQTELGDLPPFRRFGGVTAYTEGWGLYSEELGKDMGFYTDPYSDFGRLGMELWRACRLVVDTGIHDKRWSREKAIQYLTDNTPNPDGDIRKAIERYIVYPGQATAYMIGKLKIMELREKARSELGDDFDIRGFHDTVLKSGPVPLSILEENIDGWIAREKMMDKATMGE
ncbi:DUF885 domain-containing protein [Erythrobacter litoralis]|uniref:Lipoprotein n=1 Tax=Erythrobacter litoralis (strain HTCC2594) TaxID=314225 RepID=Q2N6N7_ERYLH|nr:DUF885 domain-containing protein [Erythrobacter litoralis]ABC64654.1 hypothetical protein ELI_12810 [Erythrobacter litoralis HTCC2594]